MKAGKKIKNADLKSLRKLLDDMGIFIEFLPNDIAQIKSRDGRFTVQKTGGDIMLVFEKREISLCQYKLKPLLERGEDEYKTKSLFVILK